MNTSESQPSPAAGPSALNVAEPQADRVAGSQSGGKESQSWLPPFYYDPASQKDFFVSDSKGGWVRVRAGTVQLKLRQLGFNHKKMPDEALSEVEHAMLTIQTEHNLDHVGPLAGYKAGYHPEFRGLVTSSPVFIEPVPGDWPILRQVMENLFGEQQLPYVFGWLKVSLEMYRFQRPLPGQAFVMCGPAGAGKNLFRLLISILLGGANRVRHPYQFMTGGTTFNSDMFGGETLAIEDESESRDIRARREFGSSIKMIVANEDHRCHRKYCEAVTLRPLWRIVISLNDDPERIMVLPPMDEDIADKIMLFKVRKRPMPMPTNTAEQRAAFQATLEGELPAFVDFLEKWQISSQDKSERFGIREFHHEEILDALTRTAPEYHLLDMIDEVLFGDPKTSRVWDNKAEVLARALKDKDGPCAHDARKLLGHPNTCGTYLGRLLRKEPGRFGKRIVNGHTIWTIQPPRNSAGGSKKISLEALGRLKEAITKGASTSGQSVDPASALDGVNMPDSSAE